METKRIRILAVAGVTVMLFLAVRLYHIQVVQHDEFSEAARSQYVFTIDMDNNRLNGMKCFYIIDKKCCNDKLERTMYIIHGRPIGRKGDDYVVYGAEYFDRSVNRTLKKDYGAYGFYIEADGNDKKLVLMGNGIGGPIVRQGIEVED